MSKQLSINFNPDKYSQFNSMRAFIDEEMIPELCRDPSVQRQLIAAKLDLSPSHMKNKLVASDGAKFNTDEMEDLIRKYGCEPIKYLISKYMYNNIEDEKAALKARLAELEAEEQDE